MKLEITMWVEEGGLGMSTCCVVLWPQDSRKWGNAPGGPTSWNSRCCGVSRRAWLGPGIHCCRAALAPAGGCPPKKAAQTLGPPSWVPDVIHHWLWGSWEAWLCVQGWGTDSVSPSVRTQGLAPAPWRGLAPSPLSSKSWMTEVPADTLITPERCWPLNNFESYDT